MAQATRFMYRVCGFGAHTEWKTVEFLEQLDDVQLCNWCGVASAKAGELSCSHIICEECGDVAYEPMIPKCRIDNRLIYIDKTFDVGLNNTLQCKKVRCVNVHNGCDFTGRIDQLNDHLSKSCDFYLKECSKCKETVVYKDFVSHYKACRGVDAVFIDAVDGQSLLDNIENVRRELEQALALTCSEVREAAGLLTDQLEKLRSQLVTRTGGREDSEE